MKLFIDTANVEEIKLASELGVIAGVTTNPSLIAKEGKDFREVIREITSIVNGPISAEITAEDAEGMIKEGEELASIHENIVIKIPLTREGLKATSVLSKKGIKTNLTLVFSPAQALLAARAGATYVSPFVGRLDDISADGIGCVADIAQMFSLHGIKTEIISASIRTSTSVTDSALAGAHIATVPYKVLMQMLKHPLTDAGLEKFKSDWEKYSNK